MPDNKYSLGSSKVATEHHEMHHKIVPLHENTCKFCQSSEIAYSPTMHDYLCNACGQWQQNLPLGYSTGRAADY